MTKEQCYILEIQSLRLAIQSLVERYVPNGEQSAEEIISTAKALAWNYYKEEK